MDRAAFYAFLRRRDVGMFGTSLSQSQVDGIEAIIDECQRVGADLGKTAYILATGYGETGGKMQPIRENLNYSASQIAKHFGPHRRQGKSPQQLARNPQLLGNTVYGGEWGRVNLGNTEPGDGYRFRGWGIGQWTGRANTAKAARQTGLDLIRNPALLDDVRTNARLLVIWMLDGNATGRKLSDYVSGSKRLYRDARAVWGGVDADKYVGYARTFERALEAAGWRTAAPAVDYSPPEAKPAPDPQEQPQGVWAALVGALLSIFRK